ncbi:hypothetical protein J4E91_000255 [Alternaria rosae]|nr:hypothetical protein J4E91_000255 [Alternaria rosae]
MATVLPREKEMTELQGQASGEAPDESCSPDAKLGETRFGISITKHDHPIEYGHLRALEVISEKLNLDPEFHRSNIWPRLLNMYLRAAETLETALFAKAMLREINKLLAEKEGLKVKILLVASDHEVLEVE